MQKKKPGERSKKRNAVLCVLPILCVIIIGIYLYLTGHRFTVDEIVNFTPQNHWLAAGFILILYAAKCMSPFLPVIVLAIATGTIFSVPYAIIINFAGQMICHVIPYWVGFASGGAFTDGFISKRPKIKAFLEKREKSKWFILYLLRVVGCLPGDAIGIYFGARRVSFLKYLAASMAGSLPSIILSTLIGISITDPSSPMFIVSVSASALLFVISFILYALIQRYKSKKGEDDA